MATIVDMIDDDVELTPCSCLEDVLGGDMPSDLRRQGGEREVIY